MADATGKKASAIQRLIEGTSWLPSGLPPYVFKLRSLSKDGWMPCKDSGET